MSTAPRITDLTIERNYTINLGNFESAKMGGAVTVAVNDGDPDEAYAMAVDFLETKLVEDMDQMTGDDDE